MTLVDELRAVPILDGFTDEQVAELAAAGTEETYDAGVRASSTRAVRPTTGGCCCRVASTSCAASATRRR